LNDGDVDLGLGETECERKAEPLADAEIARQSELGLECRQLVVAERRPCPSAAAAARPPTAVVVAAAASVRAGVGGDRGGVVAPGAVLLAAGVDAVRTKTADQTAVVLAVGLGSVAARLGPLICF